MNNSIFKHILKTRAKNKKIKIGFLDKQGAGVTEEDELSKKLIFTDEEGRDFSKV